MSYESIRLGPSILIPLAEIEMRVSRSSGPGGQHANTSETRVEAVFDVAASDTLTEGQKQRIIDKLGPVVRAVAQDERSQLRNREIALERLAARLQEALHVRRRRLPTRPSLAAKTKRIEEKKRRGIVKRLRREVDD